MADCLITTLKEEVEDTNLLKLGEFSFNVTSATNDIAQIKFDCSIGTTVTITIDGNGHFTNSTGSSNLGKTATINHTGSVTTLYFSTGDYRVIVDNKYGLIAFETQSPRVTIDLDALNYTKMWSLELSRSKAKGDLSSISRQKISYLYIMHTKITGNVRDFNGASLISFQTAGSLITGNLSEMKNIAENTSLDTVNLGNFSDVIVPLSVFENKPMRYVLATGGNVSGNLSSFSGKTTLTNLYLEGNPNVVGNISSLSGCTNLQSITLSNTGATGDTSSLAGLTNLIAFTYTNTAITGTWPLV